MRFSKPVNFICILAMVVIWLSACSQSDSNEFGQTPNKTVSQITIPSVIRVAALPAGATLIAEVYIDYVDSTSAPRATRSLTLPVSGNVSFTLSSIPVGSHTFTIIFKYTGDPDFTGTFELARATSDPINIASGSNPEFTFANLDASADDDNDGVSNLIELDADQPPRSNPADSTCILDKSILQNDSGQGCTLG